MGVLKRHKIVVLRFESVPTLFLYDPPRLVKRYQQSFIVSLRTARMCRNPRRWRLVIVVLVDTKRCFPFPNPGVLKVGVWFLGERKGVFCARKLTGLFWFAQSRETCDLVRRELVAIEDLWWMQKGVVDLVSISIDSARSCGIA